ncbi:MAG: sulfotransferase [Candidatus Thermoplasmatota archaeon]|nr:sulfotransferase [Candidatus Thermoplasmatota archaeon]MBU1941171.1 sulfotransferase [Candidatus Thermoplasmatota archaeon]
MSNSPIFIIGCPRSGTTLVRVMLDSHPRICCGPETHLIPDMEQLYKQIQLKQARLNPYGVSPDNLHQIIRQVLAVYMNQYVNLKKKARWAEKTPINIFHMDFINTIFPDSQIINVVRDGRDVVCSYKERWGRRTFFSAIRTWNKAMQITYHLRELIPKERYYEVRYEEMVSDPERITKEMMAFLQEEWTETLVEHHKVKHDFWNNSKQQNSKKIGVKERHPDRHSPSRPIFTSSAGKWQKNLNILEKALSNRLLAENLRKAGYKK